MSSATENQTTAQPPQSYPPAATNNFEPLGDNPRSELAYQQMILYSAIVGIAGGLVATAYYYVLEAGTHSV